MLFDVYGRYRIRVDREGAAWMVGGDGKSTRVQGLVIPSDATPDEVIDLLDVAFHETAKPGDTVVRLG